MDKEQAIKLAEDFIKQNGYTLHPADRSKLSFDIIDGRYGSIDTLLAIRHNSLSSEAYCIAEDTSRWHIGFLNTEINLEQLTEKQKNSSLPGRAVIVKKDGSEIRIEHKSPAFSNFEKLRRE